MPGRLKSTLNFKREVKHFSTNPSLVGKPVFRDGRLILVSGPKDSLTYKKNALHIKYASAFYKHLKRLNLTKVRIVPVKTDSAEHIQKYFHRPSISSLEIFIEFRRGRRFSLPSSFSVADQEHCESLLKKFPGVSLKDWENKLFCAKRELAFEANVGRYIDLGKEFDYNFKTGFSNFVIFGLDKKGVIKVGLVDV